MKAQTCLMLGVVLLSVGASLRPALAAGVATLNSSLLNRAIDILSFQIMHTTDDSRVDKETIEVSDVSIHRMRLLSPLQEYLKRTFFLSVTKKFITCLIVTLCRTTLRRYV